jgi:hypothetical protein
VGERAEVVPLWPSRRHCPACDRDREMRLLMLVNVNHADDATQAGLALECPCGAVWGPVEMRGL